MVASALSSLGPTHSQQVSQGPCRWLLSTDLTSGQKEAVTKTLRQMERDAGIWRGRDTRKLTQRDKNQMGLGEARANEPFSVVGLGGPQGGPCVPGLG